MKIIDKLCDDFYPISKTHYETVMDVFIMELVEWQGELDMNFYWFLEVSSQENIEL